LKIDKILFDKNYHLITENSKKYLQEMGGCCTTNSSTIEGEIPFYKCCFVNIFSGATHDLALSQTAENGYNISHSQKSQIQVQNIESTLGGKPCVLNVWKRNCSEFDGKFF
jgi:hypothetical protein